MSESWRDSLFCRAARGEKTERTPVWLMRQAGRTDPAYLELREKSGLPLEILFNAPEWSAPITLLPKRFGVDALIVYQDILTPLAPMGARFLFRPGPTLETPLRDWDDLDRLHAFDPENELACIPETFARVRGMLDEPLPVLGFAGAPLTLLTFLVEGGSFGETAPKLKQFLAERPEQAHRLLGLMADVMIAYLRMQANAGAAAVQLFESAAFLLDRAAYAEFALPYQQRVFAGLRGVVPTIQFAREWPHLDDLDAAGADIISLPSTVGIRQARTALGPNRVFQGNLDNHLLATGPIEAITASARACLAEGEHRGHIFNLSHGLLRETPFEHILELVKTVRLAT